MRHLFVAATLAAALPFAGLPSQFEKIAPAAKERVGVAAQLLESGETADLHGDEHFPMHSVAADLDGGFAAREQDKSMPGQQCKKKDDPYSPFADEEEARSRKTTEGICRK